MDLTDYDAMFSCPVCLEPKLGLVFGLCQHFVCCDCLYDPVEQDLLKPFLTCPMCKASNVFPEKRPDIPDSTRQLMGIIGVVKCNRKRCGEEMWTWDKEEHDKTCRGLPRRPQRVRDASPDNASSSQKADQLSRRLRSHASSKVN
uniref:Putative interleukin 1 signal transducer strongylocentrotus purpuratus n=1 Tax=Amblyomma triste TaxID=251400 RepID=A0A023G5Q9_AMBTT